MKSETSLFNKSIFFSNLKRFCWVAILYAFILFLFFPFELIGKDMNRISPVNLEEMPGYFLFQTFRHNDFNQLLMCIVPVIIGVFVFSYMQKTNSMTLMHGLPLNRNTLYFTNVLSGLTLITLPLLLNGIIIYTVGLSKGFISLGYFSGLHVLQLFGIILILQYVLFAISVFVGMFTGNSVAHIVFTYIINFLPAFLYSVIAEVLVFFVKGFTNFFASDSWLEYLPIYKPFNIPPYGEFVTFDMFLYIGITILFLVISLFLYKKRNLEIAGDLISFNIVKPIFKYGLTFCTMISGYLYFTYFFEESNIIVSILLWSTIGYFVAEMLLQKRFNVFKTYKGLVVYLLVICLSLYFIKIDITGFQRTIPNVEDISSIYFNSNIYSYRDTSNVKYKDSKVISDIRNLHEALINDKEVVPKTIRSTDEIESDYYIIYELKNGKKIVRYYTFNVDKYASYLKPIYESLEYKNNRYPILRQNLDDSAKITIYKNEYQPEYQDKYEYNYKTVETPTFNIFELSDKISLTDALKQDILNLKFEDMVIAIGNGRIHYPDYRIEIGIKTLAINDINYPLEYSDDYINYLNYAIYPCYTNTLAWINAKGM